MRPARFLTSACQATQQGEMFRLDFVPGRLLGGEGFRTPLAGHTSGLYVLLNLVCSRPICAAPAPWTLLLCLPFYVDWFCLSRPPMPFPASRDYFSYFIPAFVQAPSFCACIHCPSNRCISVFLVPIFLLSFILIAHHHVHVTKLS